MLVVDDEEAILFALTAYFTPFGFAVDSAREQEEAEALLTKVDYDVVIVDLRLSGTTGCEGFDLVRYARTRSASVLTVLLTAHGTPDIDGEARRMGADVVLHKPHPMPALARLVSGMLEGV